MKFSHPDFLRDLLTHSRNNRSSSRRKGKMRSSASCGLPQGDHPSIPARAQDQGSQVWKQHRRGNASPGKQCCPWCFGSSAYISAVPGRWHSNHSQALSWLHTDSPAIREAVLLNTSLFHLHHEAGKE